MMSTTQESSTTFQEWCQDFLKDKGIDFFSRPVPYYVAVVIACVITIITFVNNVVVFLALTLGRGRPPDPNISLTLTFSLVCADLLLSVTMMPITIYNLNGNGEDWLGKLGCRVFVIADVFLCTVSILHLVGLAVDRYLAVCRPFLHERLGITSARVACVAVWVLPGVLVFPMFVPKWQEMDVGNDSNGRCLLQLSQSDGCTFYTASPIFHSLVASLSFFLPLLIIVVLHVRICVAAHTQVRKLAKLQPSPWPSAELLADDNSGNVGQGHRIDPQAAGREDEEARFHDVAPSTSSREGQRETEHLGREKANKQPEETRAIKTVVCLVLCFVVCWAPLFVFFLLESFFGHNSPLYVLPILPWLGYLNSAINPVLYYCYNVAVRCAIRRFLRLKPASEIGP